MHAASGNSAGVRFGWARSICLNLYRHCSALTDSEPQRHLNHFNGSLYGASDIRGRITVIASVPLQ